MGKQVKSDGDLEDKRGRIGALLPQGFFDEGQKLVARQPRHNGGRHWGRGSWSTSVRAKRDAEKN